MYKNRFLTLPFTTANTVGLFFVIIFFHFNFALPALFYNKPICQTAKKGGKERTATNTKNVGIRA